MSIFRNTFTSEVKGQLKARQNAAQRRNPNDIIYQNSRNSWVRMTSGVNVGGKDTLARQYILQGGVLNNKKLREGVGDASKAYSNYAPSLNPYTTGGTAGLKPMPGITSVDVKSKTAYGSLRDVTVNFSCNNIQQLEDLELLYMRPGYTVLVEWGWTPYLDNAGNIQNNISFYDGVLDGKASNGENDREQIFKDLFKKSKDHFGNYEAHYGYVKNYNWNARADGGYDCTTTIISVGELLESLNANWVSLNVASTIANGGIIGDYNSTTYVAPTLQQIRERQSIDDSIKNSRSFQDSLIAKAYAKNILAGLCFELYNFCQGELKQANQLPTVPKLSKYKYDLYAFSFPTPPQTTPTLIGDGKSQAYITLESFVELLNDHITVAFSDKEFKNVKTFSKLSTKPNLDTTEGLNLEEKESLLCLAHPLQLSINPSVCLITSPVWAGGISFANIGEKGTSTRTIPKIPYLNELEAKGKNFRYGNYKIDEFGKIGNIYINIDFIYQLSLDSRLYTSNQELKVYDLLKNVLKEVQECIGGVNSFEIHVDPQDSVARIIDVNYVDIKKRSDVYNNATEIEMSNTKSIVRSYNLQSQIFPEQANLIALGAQVGGGGNQSSQNSTLLDFNNNIEDRIMPKKLSSVSGFSTNTNSSNVSGSIDLIKQNLSLSIERIGDIIAPAEPTVISSEGETSTTDYKTALSSIIRYFQGVTYSNTKNRAIIPVKISLTMDGIGGLIIGHLFKIPQQLLPKGYRLDSTGGKLLQIVMGISHKIDNGDWTTTIDALNMIASDPKGIINFSDLITLTDNGATVRAAATTDTLSTKEEATQKNISIAIDKFKAAGYNKFAISALIGGLIQESNLNPSSGNSNGGPYGIAQWLNTKNDKRLDRLKSFKNAWNGLDVQLDFIVYELNNSEASAGKRLKNAKNLEDAIAGAASYERYKGINVRDGVTYEEVVVAEETGRRIGFAKDIYNRIESKEFGKL
jgi:hypothetical protein